MSAVCDNSFFICTKFFGEIISKEINFSDIENIVNGFRDVVDGKADSFSLNIQRDAYYYHYFSICKNDNNEELFDLSITSSKSSLYIDYINKDVLLFFDRFFKCVKDFN